MSDMITISSTAIRKLLASTVSLAIVLLYPVAAIAQDVTENSESTSTTSSEETTETTTGAPADTGTPPEENGAPECTGAGCHQGEKQGVDQGTDQGGTSLAELGGSVDEEGNTVLPEGVKDTRQGAEQGKGHDAGVTSDSEVEATNSNTGARSDNAIKGDISNTDSTAISNTANDTSNVGVTGSTGGNTNNKNTATGKTTTGNANIGVTQIKNDNTATVGGSVGASVSGYEGDYDGDLALDFENAISLLAGDGSGKSVKAINDGTGSNSNNDIIFSFEDISDTEVQNDGKIDNIVDVTAITGQNEASKNTSDGVIKTGDANIAATLVNLLNTTVLNGNVVISVEDIFGNLTGDVVIPDLAQLASILSGGGSIGIEAENEQTGSDSTNEIDIDITDEESLAVNNEANVNTKVSTEAITGQNEASENTGGGFIDTGDANVSASNVTVANTTVEGGSWGLVIVNAFNKWVGFLVGDSGEVRQLSQDETVREIDARNSETGSDSDNSIEISDTTRKTATVNNDADITNDVRASAITGQNTANKNTGAGAIKTGDANILTTAVNIANTTVKNASLGIAVVNVFGDWLGDLIYNGSSLLAGAGNNSQVEIETGNDSTGSNSDNTIDIDIDRSKDTDIDNTANIATTLETNIDTGNNKANRNTGGAEIETGDGVLGLHARTIANLTGIADGGSLRVDMNSENDETGVESTNTIKARVNDERTVTINNDANVSTILPGLVNTGHNQANQNTIGGDIESGDIDADVVVENMINRVILALGSEVDTAGEVASVVDTDFVSQITGQESFNENDLEVTRTLLSAVFNDAVVETLIDLLFNTGHNESNQNTAGGSGYSKTSFFKKEDAGDYGAAVPSTSTDTTGGALKNLGPSPIPAFEIVEENDKQEDDEDFVAVEDDESYRIVGIDTTVYEPVELVNTPAPRVLAYAGGVGFDRPEVVTAPREYRLATARTRKLSPAAEAVFTTSRQEVETEPVAGLRQDDTDTNSAAFPAVIILGSLAGSVAGGVYTKRRLDS